ncbi:MAG: tetratricopeptide repeat protein [Myxococcales bacterium]
MRLLAFLLATACADLRAAPTFPADAAGRPVVTEQAILGLSDDGDAAVAQLIDADGKDPELTLLVFDRGGGPSRPLAQAGAKAARAVAQRVLQAGRRLSPILAAALSADWPEAFVRAADEGFDPRLPAMPEPGRRRWLVTGSPEVGALPLALRLSESFDSPRALALLLSERTGATSDASEEIELTRMTLSGASIAPELYLAQDVAWLLSGSVLPGEPLHRTVGVRRGSLARGEAQLHNAHGLADYAAGDLDAARREFDRAIAADPGWVDGLYNAAAAAALSDRPEDAVALLRRAAEADPARVQVLGRNDDDLRILRKRADVRALLGLRRPPPENVPPPP